MPPAHPRNAAQAPERAGPGSKSARGRSTRSSRAIRRASDSARSSSAAASMLTSSVQGIRRHFGDPRCAPTAARFLAVTDKGRWLRGRIVYDGDAAERALPTPRWRRSSGPTAGRSRRGAGTTPNRSPRTAARLCRHRARASRSCASTIGQRRACWRAARRSRCRPPSSRCRATGIECLEFVPQGAAARRHADRDLRARPRRGRQHPRLPDRRPSPARSRSSAATTSTSAIAR